MALDMPGIALSWIFSSLLVLDKQVNIIDAFNTTSRYLDYTLNISNIYFGNLVS